MTRSYDLLPQHPSTQTMGVATCAATDAATDAATGDPTCAAYPTRLSPATGRPSRTRDWAKQSDHPSCAYAAAAWRRRLTQPRWSAPVVSAGSVLLVRQRPTAAKTTPTSDFYLRYSYESYISSPPGINMQHARNLDEMVTSYATKKPRHANF